MQNIINEVSEGTGKRESLTALHDMLKNTRKRNQDIPKPILTAPKNTPVKEEKQIAAMKAKTTPTTRNGSKTQSSSNADAQASQQQLLQIIENLNKTIEQLTKQLEEAMEQKKNQTGKTQVPAGSSTQSGEAVPSLPSKRPHPDQKRTATPGQVEDPNDKSFSPSPSPSGEKNEPWTLAPSKRPRHGAKTINMNGPEAAPLAQKQSAASTSQGIQGDNTTQQGTEPSHEQLHAHTNTMRHKPPIINVMESSQQTSYRILKNLISSNAFKIKHINSNKHYIQLDSIHDYNATIKALRERKIRFYTFTPKDIKPLTFLIKGLDSSFDSEEILSELKSLNLKNVNFIKVANFTTPNAEKNNKKLPFFIVQIAPDGDVNTLTQTKLLLHQVVSWERLIRKDPIMCARCQRTGHTSKNCNLDFRCVKCAEKHEPGQCKLPSDTKIDPALIYCVRCRTNGHPASYKGCPKYKELKQRLKSNADAKATTKIKLLNKTKSLLDSALTKPEISYAKALSQNQLYTTNRTTTRHPHEPAVAPPNHHQHTLPYQYPPQPHQSSSQPHYEKLFDDLKKFFLPQISRLENLIGDNANKIEKLHDLYFGINPDYTDIDIDENNA